MKSDTRIAINWISIFFLGTIILTSCQAGQPRAKACPRDGALDIPVETAPSELWEASQVWKDASTLVCVVALSSGKDRSVTYSLNIGFEKAESEALRQQFHKKLLNIGWTYQKADKGYQVYVSHGRKLTIGYDIGRYPTDLVVNYTREDTQQQGGGDADKPRVSP